MRYQRVIFILSDGRKIYATHRGEVIKWTESEIGAIVKNCERYGVVADDLRRRYPNSKIIRVVGFKTEYHDQPLRKDVIF